MGNEVEGNAQLDRAMQLRKKIVPGDPRKEEHLSDEHFDELVYYLSR